MSTQSNESLQVQISQQAMKAGNIVRTSSDGVGTANTLLHADSNSKLAQGDATTASKPVYMDSSNVPQGADLPFSLPIVANGDTTTQTFLSLTGASTRSATGPLTNQIVLAADVTTFTAQAYLKVTVTDDAGNVTDGDYYLQLGTLA